MPVAVVTDSTAYLPPELSGDLVTVPLMVVIGGEEGAEGERFGPAEVAAALTARRVAVSTSRPAPEKFAGTYRGLLEAGATGVVSVHLSAVLSGTCEAATLAAAEVDPARIVVVDARSTGMGLGFCARAAAGAAAAGADLTTVAEAARAAVPATTIYFYVDTLEYLRRGGRISAASALLGTALSVKPILHVTDGAITAREKVRTASRALGRLVDLAVEAAGESDVEVAVHHLVASERARDVSRALARRLGDRLAHLWTSEVGAVVAAHVGPGLVGVVIHRLAPPHTTSGA
jgi:DegV family protein with EDD domain